MVTSLLNRVRRNHGLEHATISVLLESGTPTPLGGYSTPGGFFIVGRVSADGVGAAASEALARLQAGRAELAVSPHCGTNIATGALLAGLLTRLILRRGRWAVRLPLAMVAIVGAALLSRPLGEELQRRFTTLADAEGLHITRVRRIWGGRLPLHRISTSQPR